ncbi:MAG: CRTAC1 family protein [Acidobacteria bacterium]|nr:CRTAC1 family protein [Acidobacteriota bacterium]
MGGGVALLDYNGDGRLDVFLVNSGAIDSGTFRRNEPRHWNRLYRQNRDASFTDVTAAAGLSGAGDGNYGMGVAAADFDNDGDPDLYVTNFGRNVLYRNDAGVFRDITEAAGVAGGGWSASAGFFDYDNDGRLDLLVTRYMDWSLRASKVCGTSIPVYCPPAEFPAVANVLYRNRGDGTFEDRSVASGIAAVKGRGLGVAFADYDSDGFTDIFVANDGMEQFLFHNNGDGTFKERAAEAGAALTGEGKAISGMGAAFADFDNDGRPDVVVTSLSRQKYALWRNAGDGLFEDATLTSGLGAASFIHSGWGVALADFDNDGWKDLLVAQGHVMDNVDQVDSSLASREAPLLAANRRGRFERRPLAAGAVAGRGLAVGDLNNDGYLDAVMGVLGGAPVVMTNKGSGSGWLTLELRGGKSNRDGVGARVAVNGQHQTGGAAGSYLSSNDKRIHFGVGAAKTLRVEIRWPSGAVQTMEDVRTNQILRVEEP